MKNNNVSGLAIFVAMVALVCCCCMAWVLIEIFETILTYLL